MSDDELRDRVIQVALHWYAVHAFPATVVDRIEATVTLLAAVRPLFERDRG